MVEKELSYYDKLVMSRERLEQGVFDSSDWELLLSFLFSLKMSNRSMVWCTNRLIHCIDLYEKERTSSRLTDCLQGYDALIRVSKGGISSGA